MFQYREAVRQFEERFVEKIAIPVFCTADQKF
jgi:hypothetical protein